MTQQRFQPWGTLPRRSVELKQIDWAGATGAFTALAASFNNLDKTGDIIEPGAFSKTLQQAQERKTKTGSPYLWPICWMHDATQPCGGVISAKETAKGLQIDGQIDLDTELGKRIYAGMRNGYIGEMSIGYSTVRSFRSKDGVRHLTEVQLFEVSMVTTSFAASDEARVNVASVKTRLSDRDAAAVREFAAWARTRPPLAGADAPEWQPEPDPDLPPAPTPFAFRNGDEYEVARQDWESRWLTRHYGALVPDQAKRGKEFAQQVAAQRAQRIASGNASVSERLAAAPYDAQQEAEAARVIRAVQARNRALKAE
jgi:Escherichia/Staphylococcus phage prohead protease